MDQSLESLLERLKREDALAECGEEVIRQGAVLPILGQLGWDRDNVREVTPEFSAGKGRVDYCLRIADRPAVFMEVKRPVEELEHHQQQLLEYAFSQGVKMAVLTNGFQWWFYLPLSEGSWEQRKFFAIDMPEQDVAEVAKHFREFLSRQRVADGSAVKLAQELRESAEKSRRIEETIPRAWKELCEAPDERLLDLFADKVESLCGHRPSRDQLASFLAQACPASAAERGLPRPVSVPLREVVAEILRNAGNAMRAGEIAEQLAAAGYMTRSKNPKNLISVMLAQSGEFVRVGKGLYTVRKGKGEILRRAQAPGRTGGSEPEYARISNGPEPRYVGKFRAQLKSPDTMASKIREYIRKRGTVTQRDLWKVYVGEWDGRPGSGSMNATIRTLEIDGYIRTEGRGETKRLIWLK